MCLDNPPTLLNNRKPRTNTPANTKIVKTPKCLLAALAVNSNTNSYKANSI